MPAICNNIHNKVQASYKMISERLFLEDPACFPAILFTYFTNSLTTAKPGLDRPGQARPGWYMHDIRLGSILEIKWFGSYEFVDKTMRGVSSYIF